MGPFKTVPFTKYHLSPLGGVPKPDGSTRVILDLSSPRGSSVNDFISKEAYSVRYAKFDDAVDMASAVENSFMAKLDVRHAFRLCPVHPEDWPLLTYWWKGRFFVDVVLPFGCRSSPFIFNTFADTLEWVARSKFEVKSMLHYLDDFFFTGPSFERCLTARDNFATMCKELRVPLADDKAEGPATCLTFLGIEIDTVNRCCRLPKAKLADLKRLLAVWSGIPQCTKRELLSLVGSLSFAAKVVKPGRTFLRRLIDLSTSVRELSDIVVIDKDAREDIKWWSTFAPDWNGVGFFQDSLVSSSHLKLYTDASVRGIGAVFNTKWFSAEIPRELQDLPIHILEFYAIVVAVFTWSDLLVNKQVLFLSDNMAIVQAWTHGSCRDKKLMTLIRKLYTFTARNNVNILMTHVPGKYNSLADALSRFQVTKFQQLLPTAEPTPSTIPLSAWEIWN